MKIKQMKTYTIIAGINGTGKSSLTGVLKNQLTDLGLIIDVDKLAAANSSNNIRAGRVAVQRIRSCISRGVCFTQETTLSGSLTARTARTAREHGYYIRMLGWTVQRRAFSVSQTVYERAGMIYQSRTYVAGSLGVRVRWLPFFRTATKRYSLITITALSRLPITATVKSLSVRTLQAGSKHYYLKSQYKKPALSCSLKRVETDRSLIGESKLSASILSHPNDKRKR